MNRFPYPCQEALAQAYEARGGKVAVRVDRNGSRRVSLDGKREVSVAQAMHALERAYQQDRNP